MLSSQANPNMPPLMSPESQQPSMGWGMDPAKQKVLAAMLQQQISKIGTQMTTPKLMGGAGNTQPQFDSYGNLIG